MLPRPGSLVGRAEADVRVPHAHPPHGPLLSTALLGYYWLDSLMGGWILARTTRARTGLVVVERGWWDLAVDPRRYRIRAPQAVIRALGRMLPQPDMIFSLSAPPEVLLARKQELSELEAQRQMTAWRDMGSPGTQRIQLDASRSPPEVLAAAREHVVSFLEARAISRIRPGWTALPSRTKPRWVLPRGRAAVALGALSIYQPVTPKGLAGWQAARLIARLGGLRILPRGEAPPRAVRELLLAHLPPGGTLVAARGNHPGRWIAATISADGALAAIGKVVLGRTPADAESRAALWAEADALHGLAPNLPPPLRAPALIERTEIGLVLEP
ncbi:MAG: hypothetical protein ACRDKW_10915, partial [Actinomycetota bacterium]